MSAAPKATLMARTIGATRTPVKTAAMGTCAVSRTSVPTQTTTIETTTSTASKNEQLGKNYDELMPIKKITEKLETGMNLVLYLH